MVGHIGDTKKIKQVPLLSCSPKGLDSNRPDILLHGSNSKVSSGTIAYPTECLRVFLSEMDDRPFKFDAFAAFCQNNFKWIEEGPIYVRRSALTNEITIC